jgi:hypothetical protein
VYRKVHDDFFRWTFCKDYLACMIGQIQKVLVVLYKRKLVGLKYILCQQIHNIDPKVIGIDYYILFKWAAVIWLYLYSQPTISCLTIVIENKNHAPVINLSGWKLFYVNCFGCFSKWFGDHTLVALEIQTNILHQKWWHIYHPKIKKYLSFHAIHIVLYLNV